MILLHTAIVIALNNSYYGSDWVTMEEFYYYRFAAIDLTFVTLLLIVIFIYSIARCANAISLTAVRVKWISVRYIFPF